MAISARQILPSEATETHPTEETRTRTNLYGKLACGHGTPGLYVQVLGASVPAKTRANRTSPPCNNPRRHTATGSPLTFR